MDFIAGFSIGVFISYVCFSWYMEGYMRVVKKMMKSKNKEVLK